MIDKEFNTAKERIDWLIENKSSLIAQKKAITKEADSISGLVPLFNDKQKAYKANEYIENYQDLNSIMVKAIINTTNVIDSHLDLHIEGIWTKSIQENKNIMHLQEHQMSFKNIISDGKDLKVSTENMKWTDLGYDYAGETQALVFESIVKKSRNEEMFKQYAQGNVKNHSVGMRYIKIFLAVNDEDYKDEFATWNKYLPLAINPKVAEENGYFWVVTEAKVIEGSAVPIGSNQLTPTQDNNIQPLSSTENQKSEPSDNDTLVRLKLIELSQKI